MRPAEPVSRIMTAAVVVIESDRPLSEAFDCLRHYPTHHLPVVRAGRLAGMLSTADLIKVEYFAPRDRRPRRLPRQQVPQRADHADAGGELLAVGQPERTGRPLRRFRPARDHDRRRRRARARHRDCHRHHARAAARAVAALGAADALYVQGHDPNSVAKTLLYLVERRAYLEKVLGLADRYLTAGQDEHNHALLLKAVLAAKQAEEHAAVESGVPFPLQ